MIEVGEGILTLRLPQDLIGIIRTTLLIDLVGTIVAGIITTPTKGAALAPGARSRAPHGLPAMEVHGQAEAAVVEVHQVADLALAEGTRYFFQTFYCS